MRIAIDRDSVSMGDDAERHADVMEFPEGTSLRDVLAQVCDAYDLGSNTTWAVEIDGEAVALEARRPGQPGDQRFLTDPEAPFNGAAIHFRYFQQRDPDEVFAALQATRQQVMTARNAVDVQAPSPGLTVNDSRVHNLVQAATIGEVHLHQPSTRQAHSFANGPLCVGRIPALAAARQARAADTALAESLRNGSTAVLGQVLSGLGGVGKTQIAAAYARNRWDAGDLDLLVWVNATERESITAAYAQAGVALCGADESDGDRAAKAFLEWLDRPTTPQWLIVLDNVTDPGHLKDLWPPESACGRTVVTTRSRHAALEGAHRRLIDVDRFTAVEAHAFLEQRLGKRTKRIDGEARLAEALGFLPLALAQAAAYILDQPGLSCGDYCELLADRTHTLADLSPGMLPDDYAHSVAASLSLSIERANLRQQPTGLAEGILFLASFLDPAGIPAELFTTEVALVVYDHVIAWYGGDTGSSPVERDIRAALGNLHLLCLIDSDGDTVRIHALVQRVLRDALDTAAQRHFARAAGGLLLAVWPDPENDPPHSAILRANTARLREYADTLLFLPSVHPVLFKEGLSLAECGQVGAAAAHARQMSLDCAELLGSDHPDTLVARNNHVTWLGMTGDASKAVTMLEGLLTDYLATLGPESPSTLTARANLAFMRGEAGSPLSAVAELQALVEDSGRAIGPLHPISLAARRMLARWRGEAGDVHGAIAECRELLVLHSQVLGPDHPDTLVIRHNLATWRASAGELSEAIADFESLVPDCLRVLGHDHPDTLNAVNNLASYHAQNGDLRRALATLVDLVPTQIRVMGPDHPQTLLVRSNLAGCLGLAGDLQGASTMFDELTLDFERVFGAEDLRTRAIQADAGDLRLRMQEG